MDWFRGEPKPGIYWVITDPDYPAQICEVMDHWREGYPPILFFPGNEVERVHRYDFLYHGPLTPPPVK